jgi:hypothetical protein
MHKKYLEILIACIVLQFLLSSDKALFLRLGSSVHYFEHVISQLLVNVISLIHVVRKANSVAKTHSHKSVRVRNFIANSFQEDLLNEPWHLIELQSDIDLKWSLWKSFFLGVFDKHAPLISKRIRNKHIPWINKNTENLIFERDRMKRKAIISKSDADWRTFKSLRSK